MTEPAWKVAFAPQAEAQLRKLDATGRSRILRFLAERVNGTPDPRSSGKPLSGSLAGLWRYRVGDCRVVVKLEDKELLVLVLAIGHRREIYR